MKKLFQIIFSSILFLNSIQANALPEDYQNYSIPNHNILEILIKYKNEIITSDIDYESRKIFTTKFDKKSNQFNIINIYNIENEQPDKDFFDQVKFSDGSYLLAATFTNKYDNPAIKQIINFYKFNKNGEIDASFGHNGKDRLKISYKIVNNSRLKSLPNNEFILQTTTQNNKVYLYKFNADGGVESSFGSYGRFEFLNEYQLNKIIDFAVLKDGSILIYGYKKISDSGVQIHIIKLDKKGRPIAPFGNYGVYTQYVKNFYEHESIGTKFIAEGADSSIYVLVNSTNDDKLIKLSKNGKFKEKFSSNIKKTFKNLPHSTSNFIYIEISDDHKINVLNTILLESGCVKNKVLKLKKDGNLESSQDSNEFVTFLKRKPQDEQQQFE